jgi:hypothetical protein
MARRAVALWRYVAHCARDAHTPKLAVFDSPIASTAALAAPLHATATGTALGARQNGVASLHHRSDVIAPNRARRVTLRCTASHDNRAAQRHHKSVSRSVAWTCSDTRKVHARTLVARVSRWRPQAKPHTTLTVTIIAIAITIDVAQIWRTLLQRVRHELAVVDADAPRVAGRQPPTLAIPRSVVVAPAVQVRVHIKVCASMGIHVVATATRGARARIKRVRNTIAVRVEECAGAGGSVRCRCCGCWRGSWRGRWRRRRCRRCR